MTKSGIVWLVVVVTVLIFSAGMKCSAQEAMGTFTNPLLPVGPDPWVASEDGYYYYMNSTGSNLAIRKTRDLTDLADAEKKVVWTAPNTGPYSRDIWAPELHRLEGKWYIYFAADDGANEDTPHLCA